MGMPTSAAEIEEVKVNAGVVVNGVDSPFILSVDSTESIETAPEEKKISEGDIDVTQEKSKEKDEESEKSEKTEADKKDAKGSGDAEAEDENSAKPVVEKEKKKEKVEDNEDSEYSKKVQTRIGKLTKSMRTAERERDKVKEVLKVEKEKRLELEKKLAKAKTQTLKDSKPVKNDFENEDDYIEALTDWKIDLKLNAVEKPAVEEAEDVEEEKPSSSDAKSEPVEGLTAAMAKGREKYDDFKEVTTNESLIFSSALAEITLETKNPEDIMYYLANNPEESERLSSLSVVNAAREIGKLETKLKPPKKTKKQSKAPTPITPVTTDAKVEKDPEKMSPKEYAEWRAK